MTFFNHFLYKLKRFGINLSFQGVYIGFHLFYLPLYLPLSFSFSFAHQKRKKRTKRKRKQRLFSMPLRAFGLIWRLPPRLDRQAGSLTLAMGAYAPRSRCAPCLILLAPCFHLASPAPSLSTGEGQGGGWFLFARFRTKLHSFPYFYPQCNRICIILHWYNAVNVILNLTYCV